MPKPFTDHPGSGMHTHLSLFEGDRNAFFEAGAEFQLSKVGRSFIAGLLKHAPEITAVTNQWVNSYKRLYGGGEAPAYVCWGHNNRSAMVRVPMYKPGKGQSTRIEVRSLDTACNPYLAYALLLAAGLKGIEEGYDLPPGAEDDVWSLTEAERRALGIDPLPQNLREAVAVMERSELVAETLGEHVFDFFLRNKRAGVGGVPPAGHPLRAGPLPAGPLSSGLRAVTRDLSATRAAGCGRTYDDRRPGRLVRLGFADAPPPGTRSPTPHSRPSPGCSR